MLRTILIAAVAALLAAGATALAGTSNVFGHGGTVYHFDNACHRVSVLPPGISLKEAVNVTAQQTRCLVRRPDPFASCVRKLTNPIVETADHGTGKPGDEIGAKLFAAKVIACAASKY